MSGILKVIIELYFDYILHFFFSFWFLQFFLFCVTCADCRELDTKNCTILGGLMDANGTCFLPENVTESHWHALQKLSNDSKSPADEYFQ